MMKWFSKLSPATRRLILVALVAAVVSPLTIYAVCRLRYEILLLLGIVFLGVSSIPDILVWVRRVLGIVPPPTLAEVADAVGVFLEDACVKLKDGLAIFQGLHYDSIPIEGTDQLQYCPRWECRTENRNGIAVVCFGLLRLSDTALPLEALTQGRRVLQDLLTDDLRRGLLPLAAPPAFADGTPTLCLLQVREFGAYLYFDFVLVDKQSTADYVHRYDLPPDGGNADDQDF